MSLAALQKKIAAIQDCVSTLEGLRENCVERIKQDKLYRGAVFYYLYTMADSCVTLAQMLVKHKNLRKPQSYSEAIDILGEAGILPDAFAYEFARIAGFRNFLAHDYTKMNYDELCQIMFKKLDEVKAYLAFINAAL
ncbi:DUF86 domain-containing protein [candidate division KSB1 bacterium]|nr:DUF86 domain-containing protein [candidate division KSB1 bacterium]